MSDHIPTPTAAFHRRGLLLSGAALATAAALPTTVAAKPTKAQTAIIDAFVSANAFQGVVMLGRGGRATHQQAIGFADIEAKTPMRPETPFAIASISKWLTTLTVLKLIEQGRLSLDAPITTWLAGYRADTGARLTLRRLLSNTSGLPNLFGPATKADPALFDSLLKNQPDVAEAVRRFAEGDLGFEPGARFDYVLSNWIVVAAIIETVTGRSYREAMQAITLTPLGLAATSFGDDLARSAAQSYRTLDPLVRWPNDRLDFLAAAGGYFSTAADLLRAAHLVFDRRRFLGPASLKALTTVEAATDDYALGGRMKTLTLKGRDVRVAWETGRTAGYRSVLAHRLDGGGSVILLNNTALSQKLMDDFAKALFAAA